jgi:competence protein ComEC
MRTALVAFAAGCGLLQIQPALPDGTMLALCVLATCAFGAAGMRARTTAIRSASWLATGLLAGLSYAAACAQLRLADALPADLEGRDVEIVGVVASLPQTFERGVRFEFATERVLTAGAHVPARLQLAWYGGFSATGSAPDPRIHPGERWLLNVRLKRPHGSANPHGFDYEAWLLERGIRATGYVRPPRSETAPHLLSPFVWSVGALIDRAREHLRDRLQTALANHAHAGVIVALAIGDQRAIDTEDWQVFTRTGVGHLMSISGLHVTMIASMAGALAFMAWRRSEFLMLTLAAPRAAAVAGFATAFLYCMIAGFAVPAQRTLFMLGVAAWALWRGWFGSGLRVLAIALALVCVVDPWAPLSPGFWLSFGAVAILLLSASRFGPPASWYGSALNAQLAVTFGLVPLTLALFQQVSLAGPIANALAIPVVSFLVTPLAIAASVLPFDFVAQAAHAVLALLMTFLGWLSSFEWAIWQRAAPPLWTVALAVAGSVWLVVPIWWHWRALGAIWMMPLLAHSPPTPAHGDLWLSVLDVGQGLAVAARTSHHTLLVDTGPRYSPEADGGNRVVVPYLRGEGAGRLDGMILTHDDSDHTGGAASTLKALETGWVASSLPSQHPLTEDIASHRRCVAGTTWEWDGVQFEFLHPAIDIDVAGADLKDNAKSCVLSIRAHGKRVLLAADIEADVERQLLASGMSLASDLLVVPHHGSKTSSTEAFIDAVAPQAAVIAAGYRNRFRHPAPEIVQRYVRRGIMIYRTDDSGAITARVDADGMQLTRWRETRPRYWHGR